MYVRYLADKWLAFSLAALVFPSGVAIATERLPVDGTLREIPAENLDEPYEQDDHYVYTSSPSFSRWVYSPWTKPTLEPEQGLVLNIVEDNNRRSVLISEFTIKTEHLDKDSTYQILLEKDYLCDSEAGLVANACTLQFVIRCYGATEDSDWGITFESTSVARVEVGEGLFKLDETAVKGELCQQEIYVSSEANILPQVSSYTFKGLRVGLKLSE